MVSIIIPAYNRSHLIGQTLDAVLSQTYTQWECLVVDDGSNDDTKKVVESYCNKDSRFKYLQRPKNRIKGANACRNYGFELSKGAYINWLDSDDLLHENKLKIQIKELQNTNKQVAVCQSVFFENDDVLNTAGVWKSFDKLDEPVARMIGYDLAWQTAAALWHRDSIPEKPFDENLLAAQEWLFHCKQMHRLTFDTFIFSEEILVYVRKTISPSIGNTKTQDVRNPNYLRARNNLMAYFHKTNGAHYINAIFRSVASLVVKIITYDARNPDLIEFENNLKTYKPGKWLMYNMLKRFIRITKLDLKYAKRMMLRILN